MFPGFGDPSFGLGRIYPATPTGQDLQGLLEKPDLTQLCHFSLTGICSTLSTCLRPQPKPHTLGALLPAAPGLLTLCSALSCPLSSPTPPPSDWMAAEEEGVRRGSWVRFSSSPSPHTPC